jgi:phosphatidylserine decarboxylase
MMSDVLFVLLQYLLPQHLLSRLVGRFARSEMPFIKTLFINTFMSRFNIDLTEAEIQNADEFPSFNAFFTRALMADARPIAESPVVSPADGAISQIGHIRGSDLLQAKGQYFSLHDLLGGDANLTSEFINGSFATIYLSPRDYHRVHMPTTGTLRKTVYVPGKLFSVNQTTSKQVPGLFARNERLVCIFDTDLGPMAVILVGAMIVAAIETVFAGQVTPLSSRVQQQNYGQREPLVLEKGKELGRFSLGSTVIVLFGENRCQWLRSLKAEQPLRMGEAMTDREG